MENNFISDFKTYCETVDSTEGLEIIRNNILSYIFNPQTFVEDNLSAKAYTDSKLLLKESIELLGLLNDTLCLYDKVLKEEARKLYLIINRFNEEEIKDMLQFVCSEAFEYLQDKYNYKDSLVYNEDLKEEHLDKWYEDLYLLLDKYNI